MAPKNNNRYHRVGRNNFHQVIKDVSKGKEFRKYSSAVYGRKDKIHGVRYQEKNLNIPKLVYKFLGNVASLDNAELDNQEDKNYDETKKPKSEKRRPAKSNVKSVTTRSVDTSSTICTVPPTPTSAASAVTSEKKFSIQAIKDYIKAGIAEGKKRAKRYMCKALSFGVDTGYLIPTDSDGQVLRVSSALADFKAQKDEGERDMRQKLRRGNATFTSQERKLLRRRGVPVPQKRPRSASSISSGASSTKRSRSKIKKPKYTRKIRKHKPRNSKRVKIKRRRGRPRSRISSAKLKASKSSPNMKADAKKEETRGEKKLKEETLTPSRSEDDNEKAIKNESLSELWIGANSSKSSCQEPKEK